VDGLKKRGGGGRCVGRKKRNGGGGRCGGGAGRRDYVTKPNFDTMLGILFLIVKEYYT
jgi:hypothetical protein